jgi:hypothetical protein
VTTSQPTRTFLMALAGFGLVLGSGFASEPDGLDALVPQQGTFETTLVRPGVDVSGYSRVVPEPVELTFREIVLQEAEPAIGSMIAKRTQRIGTPKRKDVKMTRQAFDQALRDELRNAGRFEVVDTPGPGTLIVRPSVVDIVSRELADAGHKPDPGAPPIVRGTIVFDLIDADSGVIQARVSDRRGVDADACHESDERWGPVMSWARSAAADLCGELEKMSEQAVG